MSLSIEINITSTMSNLAPTQLKFNDILGSFEKENAWILDKPYTQKNCFLLPASISTCGKDSKRCTVTLRTRILYQNQRNTHLWHII